MRAVIIDDEEKGRKLLRNLLDTYCTDIEVVGMADSVAAGVEAVRAEQPDMIFLDIVMPNENGFELLDKIADLNCEVIFTTAYDQYAIRAVRVAALDYLLKPIDVEDLQAAVERARQKMDLHKKNAEADERLATFIRNMQSGGKLPEKIGFPTSHGVQFYDIEDIYVCKAEGNYTTIFLRGNEKVELVSKTLKEFEELLLNYNFIRTHRSYLVNLNHLKEYRRSSMAGGAEGEGGFVLVAKNLKVPVSRDKRKALLERISQPF